MFNFFLISSYLNHSTIFKIWDYDPWKLNDFRAHLSVPLKEIAEGNIMQTRILTKPKEEKRNNKKFCLY